MKTKQLANDLRTGGLIITLIAAEILAALLGWPVGPVIVFAGVLTIAFALMWMSVGIGWFYTIGQFAAIEQIGEKDLDPR